MQWKYTPQRFWSKIDRSGGPGACWPWRGTVTKNGYGLLGMDGKRLYAHRVAYELTYGAIPDGKMICHHCDNRVCCNPSHFFVGTAKDNAVDMVKKHRNFSPSKHGFSAHGEKHWKCKLSETQVDEIRALYSATPRERRNKKTKSNIAEEYGISVSTVSGIVYKQARVKHHP